VHTLAPALVEGPTGTGSSETLALATPGADGQVQTLLQVLARMRFAGASLPRAVAAPRWRSVAGRLCVEASHPHAGALRERGHEVEPVADGDGLFGAVVAAGRAADGTVTAVGDWRRDVAAGGV
jgi:gamma-glutamyltranspeptidase/glutathione hydrolase